jgi:hypothetical protein
MKPRRRHSCQSRGSTSVLMFRCITCSWVQRNVPPEISMRGVDPTIIFGKHRGDMSICQMRLRWRAPSAPTRASSGSRRRPIRCSSLPTSHAWRPSRTCAASGPLRTTHSRARGSSVRSSMALNIPIEQVPGIWRGWFVRWRRHLDDLAGHLTQVKPSLRGNGRAAPRKSDCTTHMTSARPRPFDSRIFHV